MLNVFDEVLVRVLRPWVNTKGESTDRVVEYEIAMPYGQFLEYQQREVRDEVEGYDPFFKFEII